jgi:hypothetical protein
MVVWNFGEEDIKTIRVILAANGIYAADMTDIDAMGIPDPEGHHRHTDDWKSNDGRTEYKPGAHCPTWLHEDQASSRNITYEMDPLEAWKKIVDSPQIVKFLGGKRYRPKQDIGVTQIVLQGVAVNWAADGHTPKFPAAFLKVDLGIVPGAQQSPEISNWLQDEILARIKGCSGTESL